MFIGGREGRLPTHSGHWCGRRACRGVRLYAGLLTGPRRPKIELYQGKARHAVFCG